MRPTPTPLVLNTQAHRAPCMQSARQHTAAMHPQPLLSLLSPGSNGGIGCHRAQHHPLSFNNSSRRSQRAASAVVARANKPDRGSVAALEAAIGAINGILGAHNSRRAKQQQKQQQQQGGGSGGAASSSSSSSTAAGGGGVSKTTPGPSKLISFSAKASASVPVKEWYKLKDDDPVSPSSSSSSNNIGAAASDAASTSSSSTSSSTSASRAQQQQHHHHQRHSSNDRQPLKPPAASEWPRSLQAYLSLPLEQYSVLDPSLVTRLPPGTDTELLLTKLLAARKEKRAAAAAAAAAAQQKQKQEQQQQDEKEAADSSSSGTSLEPKMRELQQQAGVGVAVVSDDASDDSSSTNGASSDNNGSSHEARTGGAETASPTAAAAAAATEPPATPAAVADAGEAGGSFLLRIPMEELVGIALEALLIITVDIDPVHGQVEFRASRLVVGDERFDSEFKVDLQAVASSKVNKQPHTVHAGPEHSPPTTGASTAAAAAAGGGGGDSSNGSSSSLQAASSSSSSGGDAGTSPAAAAATAATATAIATRSEEQPAGASDDQQQQQQPGQVLYWQRTSGLSCKVNLSMTLRLPYPLSVVPGLLLSTTAGLVAKLVMQSLLPSFLELLATDYGRWASGSSRAAPVGSLVAAGKQHLASKKR